MVSGLSSCFTTKKNIVSCDNFRTGYFKYEMYNKSGLGHWRQITILINRNDSTQTEVNSSFPGDTTVYNIKWNSACTYELILKESNDKFVTEYHKYADPIYHKIVKASDNYYIYKYRSRTDTVYLFR